MILGAGEAQIPIIQKCNELNLKTIVVDINPSAVGFKYAKVKLVISTIDSQKVLDSAILHDINAIITTSDFPVRTVACVSEKLGLNGLSAEAAKICTNKYLMRKFLFNNNFLCPKFVKITNKEDLYTERHKFEFPVIIKPVDSSASRGVKKVENYTELLSYYNEAASYSKCGDVIIEDFIEGEEYSIEALSYRKKIHIIAITEKNTSGLNNTFFVEERHITPAKLSENEAQQTRLVVINAINKMKLNNCAIHAEVKLTKKGPVIIEIGARLGGDYITSDLVPLSTGIDMLKLSIDICLNNDIIVEHTKKKHAGIQYINSNNFKNALKQLKIKKTKKEVIRSEIKMFKPTKLKSSLDRMGYIICQASTREKLNSLLDFNSLDN